MLAHVNRASRLLLTSLRVDRAFHFATSYLLILRFHDSIVELPLSRRS